MTTLSLDTGTDTGWAIRIGSVIHSGTQNFQHDAKRESPGMRFLRFSKWLRGMIKEHDVVQVIYEQPHQRGGAATTVGVGLATHLMSVCAELEVEHVAVHSGTLKKFATGKGNANKDEMYQALLRDQRDPLRARTMIPDDNEVDAIWLLLYSEEM